MPQGAYTPHSIASWSHNLAGGHEASEEKLPLILGSLESHKPLESAQSLQKNVFPVLCNFTITTFTGSLANPSGAYQFIQSLTNASRLSTLDLNGHA